MEAAPPSRPLNLFLVLFLSFLVLALGGMLDYVARSTDRWDGFILGGIMVLFSAPLIWGIFVLPINLLVWVTYRLAKWRRFRTAWLLAPSFAMVGIFVIGRMIIYPPTAEGRFLHTTGQEFPKKEVIGLVCSFKPDSWADSSYDDYVFTCAPEVTARLIHDLRLTEGGDMDLSAFRELPGGLTADQFRGEAHFKGEIRPGWTVYLKTDESRTRVHLHITGE